MLKKTIPYVDYNDNKREEDFYFNLTETELSEMQLEVTGGLTTICLLYTSPSPRD